jgi:hypothetical protein
MTDRELLAEALEVMLSAINSGDWKVDGACDPHATFVRLTNQLSKPESDAVLAEPVAWREVAGKTTHYYDYNEEGRGEPLYAAPQPDLARVGEVGVWGEWVGLTDEERKAFSYFVNWEMLDQIEAKLKEKNT